MRIYLLLLLLVLPIIGSVQIKKPVAKPTATPAPILRAKVEIVPRQKVIVEKTNGDRLTGLFVTATAEKVTISVSGATIDIPLSEIGFIKVNDTLTPPLMPASEQTTLAIEAAVVYKTGGTQALARAEMALFDKSLTNILSEAGVPTERDHDYPTQFGFAMKFPSMYLTFNQRALSALQPHKVLGFTTDFQGKAVLTEIKEGTYWIVCYYETRGGFVVWDLPVTVKKGNNYIVMDQKNAAVAF